MSLNEILKEKKGKNLVIKKKYDLLLKNKSI